MTNLSGANLNNGTAVGPEGEGKESPSRFQKYPAYKDSGVEWLGDVPEHWVMGSLKNMALIRNGRDYKEVESSDGEYPVIGSGGQFTTATQYLYEGESVLLGRKGTIDKPLYINGRFWTVDTMFYTEISRETCAKFFYYCSLTIPFDYYSTSTALPSMTQADLLNHPTAIPSKLEQTQIARFLDHETARIDALIEEQQRLIELLKEKRQAVISHAVTKGLDPTVPMKNSGVEWLGEVPAHWVVAQLKFSAMEMQTGPFGSQLHAEDYVDSGIPLINPAHMIEGKIIHDPRVTVDEQTWRRLKRHALAAGDMIFARRGELGRCAIVTEGQEGWLCGTGSLKVKLGKQLDAEYAYLLITSPGVVSELSLESKGSTMENLNTETLGRIRLPLPPVNEQKAILEHVNNVAGQFGELIYTAENGIRLMVERRSALISAAVTGKIDVRNWQPPAKQYPVGDAHNRTEPEAV